MMVLEVFEVTGILLVLDITVKSNRMSTSRRKLHFVKSSSLYVFKLMKMVLVVLSR